MKVKMYCIEYINKHGCRDWLAEIFFSKRQAIRFAKRNVDRIGVQYTIKGV